MHEAVTLWPLFEFLSCRVCVALPMFIEGKEIAAEAFTGVTPRNHSLLAAELANSADVSLLCHPTSTAQKHERSTKKPVQFTV